MIPSPFHGIFSSSVHSQEGETAHQAKAVPSPHKHVSAPLSAVPLHPAGVGQARPPSVGQVALDIFEYDNYYIIKAPIAGVRLSDLDIEVSDNVLTIRGVRRQTDTIAEDQYYLKECFWGEFQRSVTLPCSIDPRKIKATFNKDSILKVIVPKQEGIKIVRIND